MKNTKLKTTLLTLAACFTSATVFGQTVTLLTQTDNFADSGGNVTSGLYGIVVDTDGTGFALGQYGPFDSAPGAGAWPDSFLTTGDGSATSDGLVYTNFYNDGFIGGAPSVRHSSGEGIASTGDQFGIMWFPGLTEGDIPSVGDSYGFFTNDNLTIPSAGDTTPYGDFITDDIKTADYTVVPEPSTYAAIFGFGVLLFVFLRRRFKK